MKRIQVEKSKILRKNVDEKEQKRVEKREIVERILSIEKILAEREKSDWLKNTTRETNGTKNRYFFTARKSVTGGYSAETEAERRSAERWKRFGTREVYTHIGRIE